VLPSNSNGQLWKWVAGILAALLIAGVPSYLALLRAPSAEEIADFRREQQMLSERLAVVETQLAAQQEQLDQINEAIAQARAELQEHANR
jgi:septal ring factor EnvC (AmiA/AmiB activator)